MTRICKSYVKGQDCSEWEGIQAVVCKGHKIACPCYEPKPYKKQMEKCKECKQEFEKEELNADGFCCEDCEQIHDNPRLLKL